MSIAAALAELIRSPDLFDHIAHLERFLAEETCRREQFRADLDEDTRTEFINGKVVVHTHASPEHQRTTKHVAALMNKFVASRGKGKVFLENCRVGCQRNDYQPDVCFFDAAGSAELTADQKIFPPPTLIAEVVALATEANDRKLKLEDYARHGVDEYWIIDPGLRLVEQYVMAEAGRDYRLKVRLAQGGTLNSAAMAGFSVPVSAFFEPPGNQQALSANSRGD